MMILSTFLLGTAFASSASVNCKSPYCNRTCKFDGNSGKYYDNCCTNCKNGKPHNYSCDRVWNKKKSAKAPTGKCLTCNRTCKPGYKNCCTHCRDGKPHHPACDKFWRDEMKKQNRCVCSRPLAFGSNRHKGKCYATSCCQNCEDNYGKRPYSHNDDYC